MNLSKLLIPHIQDIIKTLYQSNEEVAVSFQATNPQFAGDITLVTFPYIKLSKQSPEHTGAAIGEALLKKVNFVAAFNVVKGFLNIEIKHNWWLSYFNSLNNNFDLPATNKTWMVEYSSPNTNKPLHLGHVRNILLGYSVANILQAAGNKVVKVNLVNDRGIHICKSMLAYQLFGNGETPQSSGIKGDHLVGKYYVLFDKHYRQEVLSLIAKGITETEVNNHSTYMLQIGEMLRKWEAGDEQVLNLWRTMNSWVYEGFNKTYTSLNVSFDKTYYESNTYLLGKEIVEEGLQKNVFFEKEDGSVWIDLTADKLDEKIVLRKDGTSVYITQDIGTAVQRANEFKIDGMIYTVGNEQDYHFKVLFKTLEKLGYNWANNLHHLSYGMVELPDGKMKSREGTVVDADDLIQSMLDTAKEITLEQGKTQGLGDEELSALYHTVGLGALKYYLLRVDPKKKMLFDPKESIDFNGNTAPFIQYTYARINSILQKAIFTKKIVCDTNLVLHMHEHQLLKQLYNYELALKEAANTYSPAAIANYVYDLAKVYNQFYHDCKILKEENQAVKEFRLSLSKQVADTISFCLQLLGITVPQRM